MVATTSLVLYLIYFFLIQYVCESHPNIILSELVYQVPSNEKRCILKKDVFFSEKQQ